MAHTSELPLSIPTLLSIAGDAADDEWAFKWKFELKQPEERTTILSKAEYALGPFARQNVLSEKDRNNLLILVRVLNSIAQAEERRRTKLLQAAKRDCQKLAKIAKKHPKGRLIGATQVATYTTPGANLRWGSSRKKRA